MQAAALAVRHHVVPEAMNLMATQTEIKINAELDLRHQEFVQETN